MKYKTTFLWLLGILCSSLMYAQAPNVVIVIADDMGWNQISTGLTNLNNPSDFYETPRLDILASEGIAFPNGYVNGANCAPTRAALLSGQYASRPDNNIFNVYDLNRGNTASNSTLIGPDMGLASNGNIDEIPSSAITIAETMKSAGYVTAHFGKYHMGEDEASNVSNNAATDQGFDYNYGGGTKGGPGNYFATQSGGVWTFHGNIGPELDVYADPYTEAESIALSIDHANHPLTGTPKHVSDAMTEAALDFITTEINNPFFMHFSQFAIHGPFGNAHARPDLLAKYQAKASSNPSSMDHDSTIGQVAIAEGMDQAIGRLIDFLKTTPDPRNGNKPLSENTLVYFIADNGDAIKRTPQAPLRGMKGEYYEGGIRSITIAWSEAPWLANKGTINMTPVIGFDLYPTAVEMAGGSLPGGGYPIDGTSLWPMLNGTNPNLSRDHLIWHFPGYLIDSKRDQRPVTVVRKGDYKLIHNYETATYEMYDLVNDLNETTNLLAGSPDQATVDIANDMVDDMIDHITDKSSPLPTYRSNGATVPLPAYFTLSTNSVNGCQPTSGYTAFWDYDTVSSANDASGNNNNAIAITGTLSYDLSDTSEGDQSAVFNGSTEIRYDSTPFLNDATTARTVLAWIKPTALSGTQEIFEEGGSGNGLALRLNGTNLEARITNNTDPDVTVSAPYPNDGGWHHVALVFDGTSTSMAIYIDGVVANSTSSAFSILESHSSPGGVGGVIGGGDAFGSGANDSFFTGKMDAIAIYDIALTPLQVDESACASTLGITEVADNFGSIYPNPFNASIQIQLKSSAQQIAVELYDITGKVLINKQFTNRQQFEINGEDLSSGIYLIKVKADNTTVTKKVIKK